MQFKYANTNQAGPTPFNVANSTLLPESWWKNIRFNSSLPTLMRVNASDSSIEQSMDDQSQTDCGINEEDDDTSKQSTIPLQPDDNREDTNLQQVPRNDGRIMLPPHIELVGHSVACAPNPYEPYYGGTAAAYYQPLVPHLFNAHHPMMTLPIEMAQEPVYVNAKQYPAIMRRRQSRAKAAELEKKLTKERKPYLHESRHRHALRRERASGGRFAKKSDADTSKGTDSKLSQSFSSSGSESLISDSNGAKVTEPAQDVAKFSGQQWGNRPSNHAYDVN